MKTMATIKKHLISSKESTPLYSLENLTDLRMKLPKGNWLGVLEKKMDKLRVLTTFGEGWISLEDACETNYFDFKVRAGRNGELSYVVS
ncbi:hypothetical protein [Portibacter marinus]|uniref:hypothetical protein n=1 Tax=Portibacter marinus TaxID=2898660 RepID=UPI001F1654C9|nr:hypothetical protein [Portibacter marinus]